MASGLTRESLPQPAGERWLTTSQVAVRLGIKRATVYAYVSRGVLRRIRLAGRRDSWFDLAEIEQFLSTRSSTRTGAADGADRPERAPV